MLDGKYGPLVGRVLAHPTLSVGQLDGVRLAHPLVVGVRVVGPGRLVVQAHHMCAAQPSMQGALVHSAGGVLPSGVPPAPLLLQRPFSQFVAPPSATSRSRWG